MKIMQVFNGKAYYDMTSIYSSVESARMHFSPDIQIESAPDHVIPGWGFDPSKSGDDRWVHPEVPEGWIYNEETGEMYNPVLIAEETREYLHAMTTNDTLQALRKIREGDKTIDWEAWLDALDEYNRAVEDTTNQKDYPLKVVYPEYPVRPTV